MRITSRAALALLLAIGCFVGPVSAATTTSPIVAQAAAASAKIVGRVHDQRGNNLSGAAVTVEGAGNRYTATTGPDGSFSVSVLPGLYRIAVTKAGFQVATNDDTPVVAGETLTLSYTLNEANLSSLRVIGSTSTTVNRAPLNGSESAISTLPSFEIAARQNNNLTSLVADLPGVTATTLFSSTPNTSFAVHGFPLQTRVTIDGHAVSSGISGQWNTNYAAASIFQAVDVVKGAGINGSIAGESAVGTVNLRTRDFTAKDSAGLSTGFDQYGGTQYSLFVDKNFLKNDRLSLILQKAFSGYNGPYDGNTADRTNTATSSAVPLGTNQPQAFTALDQWTGDFSNRYSLEGELVKLRYRFTDTTSVTLEYLGLQGQYQPQGGSYGTYNGPQTLAYCQAAGAYQFTAAACPASATFSAPYTFGGAGNIVNGYTWFPNSFIQNNEPQFSAEFRTSIHNDTILLRPYTHLINRFISGAAENQYPGNGGGWYAVTNVANCQVQFYAPGSPGVPVAASGGAAGPCFSANLRPTSPAYIGGATQTPVFGTTATAPNGGTCSPTPPFTCFTTPTGIQNNGQYGFSTPFSQPELDRLSGYTFTYIHPVGDNTYTFSADSRRDYAQSQSSDTTPPAPGCQYVIGSVNGGSVFLPSTSTLYPDEQGCSTAQNAPGSTALAYNLYPRSPIGTPPTVEQYLDLSLSGIFQVTPSFRVALGNYLENYRLNAQIEDPAVLQHYATLGSAAASPVSLIGQNTNYTHYDPHIGLEWRVDARTSLRANGGSSITQPYPALVSGFGSITLPNAANGQNYTNSIPNYNLKPETVVAYDFGADHRLPDGGVISADVYDITIHNVFLSQTTTLAPVPGIVANNYFQTNYTNGPLERSYGLELQLLKNPPAGFGYYLTGSLNRTYYDQLPLSLYSGNTAPNNVNYNINQVQIFGIPFFKSYDQVFFRHPSGFFAELGVDWEGQDNSTYGPSYTLFDSSIAVPVVNKNVTLQLSVQNLTNTNVGNVLGRTLGNQGNIEPGVYLSNGTLTYAGAINPTTGKANTAVATPLQALSPRTFRLSFNFQL